MTRCSRSDFAPQTRVVGVRLPAWSPCARSRPRSRRHRLARLSQPEPLFRYAAA
jgi:hypothetical protein